MVENLRRKILVFLVLQGLNTIITVELDRFRLFIEHCNYIGNELISMV